MYLDPFAILVLRGLVRHDNDRKQPRTLKEIYQLNRDMARRMEDIFVSKGIPVIPSIGTLTPFSLDPNRYVLTRFLLRSVFL